MVLPPCRGAQRQTTTASGPTNLKVGASHRPPPSALRTSAFTLVEVLASLLFLAIAVPAIVGALGVASRTSEVAERSSVAGGLAENKLNEMLVDNAWQSAAQPNGNFGADFPFYRWQMSTQTWTGGTNPAGTGGLGGTPTTTTNTTTGTTGTSSLTELSVEVFYPVQGSERSVRLTTVVNAASPTPSPSPVSSGTSATTK